MNYDVNIMMDGFKIQNEIVQLDQVDIRLCY
jgi:hypothetical protein